MTTLVDTNILVDLFDNDPLWAQASLDALQARALHGPLLINDVVLAEVAVRFRSLHRLEESLDAIPLVVAAMPREALFRAGHAHAAYRARGGTRTGVLPDFLIGAQAMVLGLPLLTRDVRRYRTYFPEVDLITP